METLFFSCYDRRLRRGEGLALEWHLDVDWDLGGFHINRSIYKTSF